MINSTILKLRLDREWTQEELSTRSGISVRTISNLESGRIRNPRHSTVDLLLTVLDPDLSRSMKARASQPPSARAGAQRPAGAWHGPRPARTPLIGRAADVEALAELVSAHQITVLTGPGGVGKSRLALAVGEAVGARFPGGVVVAELGRIPREGADPQPSFALALRAVADLVEAAAPAGRPALLVLDNAEHLPQTTALLVQHAQAAWPELHLIVTSRCALVLSGARTREVAALAPTAAEELLAQRIAAYAPAAEAAGDPSGFAQLSRTLDGIPRLIEFAAYRLRSAPLCSPLSAGDLLALLRAPDFLALPHQRSLEASLRWSWDLLSARQQYLLGRLAGLPAIGCGDAHALAATVAELPLGELVCLAADLVDSSMLQLRRGTRYEYQILDHVRAFVNSLTHSGGASGPAREVPEIPGRLALLPHPRQQREPARHVEQLAAVRAHGHQMA